MTVTIEPMTRLHLDAIWNIECVAHTHPWSRSMIQDIDSRGACHHVLLVDNKVAGYFYAQNIVGEMTLLNIAVDPVSQGRGYGRKLMEHLLHYCESVRAESIWLEVRESNHAAYSLYSDIGFHEVDRRRDYYPAAKGREDAIIMSYLFFA